MTSTLRRTAGTARRAARPFPSVRPSPSVRRVPSLRRVPSVSSVAVGLCAVAALALTGCGDTHAGSSQGGSGAQGSVPAGWGTLTTKGVDVSYPKGADGYVEQGAAERGKAAAAAAVRTEDGVKTSTLTVQLDFTKARSAEEAAIGSEAQVQLGATLQGTKKIALHGASDARRVDFDFTSTGADHTPPKGTRVHGVILTGLDSTKKTFAVRIDAQRGSLPDADLKKIIESIEVH